MRVLVVHVAYRHRGGEDAVVEREVELLRSAGVDASTLIVPSDRFESLPRATQGSIALRLGDHSYGRSLLRQALDREQPDIVHAHNLYPSLGVGALREAKAAGVRTVHTWHNYRASCIAGTHLYKGRQCTDCSTSSRSAGCVRGCYRGSRIQSVLYARAMKVLVDAVRTGVPEKVVCLTAFQREWFIRQGIPESSLVLKPNSMSASAPMPFADRSGALYVGRLSPEKGVEGLVQAWRDATHTLQVIGDGSDSAPLSGGPGGSSAVLFRGEESPQACREAMARARVVLVPSLCFEALPMVVIEALAAGTPVLTFAGGSVERVASVGAVPRGDYSALVAAAIEICRMEEVGWQALSSAALSAHEAHFSDSENVARMLEMYSSLLGSHQ